MVNTAQHTQIYFDVTHLVDTLIVKEQTRVSPKRLILQTLRTRHIKFDAIRDIEPLDDQGQSMVTLINGEEIPICKKAWRSISDYFGLR